MLAQHCLSTLEVKMPRLYELVRGTEHVVDRFWPDTPSKIKDFVVYERFDCPKEAKGMINKTNCFRYGSSV